MPFYTEAHPIDRPDLSVPVSFPVNSSREQVSAAYDKAAHEAALMGAAEIAGRCAIVFACHEVEDTLPRLGYSQMSPYQTETSK